jgi:putative tryptophan/tyrosine transport system substrate-binding protein
LTHLAPELGGKRLEFLKAIVPKLSQVAVLTYPGTGGHPRMKELETAGPALGLQLRAFEARDSTPLESAFPAIRTWGAGALVVLQLPTLHRMRVSIVDLAAKNRMPAMYPNTEYVEAGGLMSYAADIVAMFRRSGSYVHRILKGVTPGELPVEQPVKFELLINLRAASQMDLTIPPNVLTRADRVIR